MLKDFSCLETTYYKGKQNTTDAPKMAKHFCIIEKYKSATKFNLNLCVY